MAAAPAPAPVETAAVARSQRTRRLSSSDFGEGDLLADKYRIESVLGEGGMGIVLRATHIDLGCRVAIKVMRPGLAQNEAAVNRLMAEAQAAASIRSEHVARVLDVGRLETGAPFLVLEYLEGRDLAQILVQRGHLVSHVAVDFVLQACQALSEAHGAGIIHRDLKPENLFLSFRADGTPIVKVLDFGVSKRLTREGREAARTNPSELLGSPLYMAPEQMRGSADIDARADIWSLGVVLYELCTGQSPFFGETIPAICARVIGIDPIPPRKLNASLSVGLERIILRCLNKDRAQRPSDVAQLAAELVHYGSADAAAYAQSALRVLATVRTDPAFELEPERTPVSERIPTALSATLPATEQGPLTARRSRFQPRAQMLGVALAMATVVGGAISRRGAQPVNAPVQAIVAPATHSSVALLATVAEPSALLGTTAPPSQTRAPARPPSKSSAAAPLKRAAKNGSRNAWDPKSFGGRL